MKVIVMCDDSAHLRAAAFDVGNMGSLLKEALGSGLYCKRDEWPAEATQLLAKADVTPEEIFEYMRDKLEVFFGRQGGSRVDIVELEQNCDGYGVFD